MAGLAIRTQLCLVNIVSRVTIVASGRRRVVCGRKMALITGRRCMHAYQWKMRQVMIKLDVVFPAFLVVAAGALLTLLAFMHIVFFMAVEASGFQFLFGPFLMTIIAQQLAVTTA